MSYLAPIPAELHQVEVVKVYVHLQFSESFDLPAQALLQLRREFLAALKILTDWGDAGIDRELHACFQPELSPDPQVRRVVQKPAPSFVLQPELSRAGFYQAQQRLVLPVLFLGKGVHSVNAFVDLLELMGQQGIYRGTGKFSVEAVESEDASGQRAICWSGGEKARLVLPVSDLAWVLERDLRETHCYVLDFVSPLRLVKNRKPLFKIDFAELFPFLLRRLNSMLTSHASVEVINSPRGMAQLAERVETLSNSLRWEDWRSLQAERHTQELGGLRGKMVVKGEALGDLAWVLQLGSYLNVGKGAAYGAGQYLLRTSC